MKALLTFLLVTVSIAVFAQHKVLWEDFIRDNSGDTSIFEMNEVDLLSVYLNPKKVDLATVPPRRVRDGRLVIDRRLEIQAPKMEIGDGFIPFVAPILSLRDLHFTKLVTLSLENSTLAIDNCIFEQGLFLQMGLRATPDAGSLQKHCSIENSKVMGEFQVSTMDNVDIHLARNQFELFDNGYLPRAVYAGGHTNGFYVKKMLDSLLVAGKKAWRGPYIFYLSIVGSRLGVMENTFSMPEGFRFEFELGGVSTAQLLENSFSSDVVLSGSAEIGFTMAGNSFAKTLSINDLAIPSHHQIKWDGLDGHIGVTANKLVTVDSIPAEHYRGTEPLTSDFYSDRITAGYLYNGSTQEELLDKDNYDKLMETYKFLYDSYKGKGNLESSNACFVAAKDLEGRRLAAIYNTEGGFKNFFGWKLNQLMKFYTNHATEPELALVVSVYIIIAFSIFYFFFPSEWDVESKGNLVRHYREFAQKNEKGYVRPFFKMLLGLFVSFVNAITLSLNSFVTLGFGNIPTKGIARYVCIVQGFLGWFLLSIFTVALFNQVLF